MESTELTLRGDPNLQELVHALALSERFSFQILVCNPPRLSESVLELVYEEVSAIRKVRSPIFEVDPYRGLNHSKRPIDFSALVSRALEPLLSLPKELDKEVLVFLNASRASHDEEPAWRALFHKMNELRNQISRTVPFPLTLCLPPGFDILFAKEATDFWSIRSASVTINFRYEHFAVPGFSPSPWPEAPAAASSERLGALQKELAIARHQAQDQPSNIDAQYSLLLKSKTFAEAQNEAQLFHEALRSYQDSMQIAQALIALAPQRDEEWLWEKLGLAVSISDIYIEHLKEPEPASQLLMQSEEEVSQFLLRAENAQRLRLHLGPVYLNLSKALEDQGKLEESERWCHRALGVWEATGLRFGEARAYGQLGRLAKQQGRTPEAKRFYLRAIALFNRSGEVTKLAELHLRLGNIEFNSGELNAAEEQYRKALSVALSLRDYREIARAQHELGTVAIERGNWDEAEEQYRKILTAFEVIGDSAGLANAYHELGVIASARGNHTQAEDWYQRALTLSKEAGDVNGQVMTLVGLGGIASRSNDLERAEGLLREALELAEGHEELPLIYHHLAMVAFERGDAMESMILLIRSLSSFPNEPKLFSYNLYQLALLSKTLGEETLERVWREQTDQPLSEQIRKMLREIREQIEQIEARAATSS